MIIGRPFHRPGDMLDWVERWTPSLVTRRVPAGAREPDPSLIEDCYAGLIWTAEHAAELGYRPGRARHRPAAARAAGSPPGWRCWLATERGPDLAGQVLICPMLDDRNETVSSHQFDGLRRLGPEQQRHRLGRLPRRPRAGPTCPVYAAPARATDLSGLPPAFIDVGPAEVFRDEDVAYAGQIWADGGAELHVWPGGFHGFDQFAPGTALSVAMVTTRNAWLRRTLAVPR